VYTTTSQIELFYETLDVKSEYIFG